MEKATSQPASVPIEVTATPVYQDGYGGSNQHAASAVPVNSYGQTNAQQAYVAASAEPASNEATCRQCGRRFTRPPNTNNATAAYFRCEECNSSWTDIFAASCSIM